MTTTDLRISTDEQTEEALQILDWLHELGRIDCEYTLLPARRAQFVESIKSPSMPADPSEMYQAGWVYNSKRAAIKAAYEKQLNEWWKEEFK